MGSSDLRPSVGRATFSPCLTYQLPPHLNKPSTLPLLTHKAEVKACGVTGELKQSLSDRASRTSMPLNLPVHSFSFMGGVNGR